MDRIGLFFFVCVVVVFCAQLRAHRFFLDARVQKAPPSVVQRHNLLAWIGAQSFMLLALAYGYRFLGYANDFWVDKTATPTALFLLLLWTLVMGLCYNSMNKSAREFAQGIVPFVSLLVCCFYAPTTATIVASLAVVVFGLLPPKIGMISIGSLRLSPVCIMHYGWIVGQVFFLKSLGLW